MKSFALLILVVSYCCALPTNIYETEWKLFKERFNKQYETNDEELRRFKIFCDKLDEIKENNEKYERGLASYEMRVNQFTDMTKEEMEQYLGYKSVNIHQDEWNNSKNNLQKLYESQEAKVLQKQDGQVSLTHPIDSIPASVFEEEWKEFKNKYHKYYGSQQEEEHRFRTFSENVAEIIEHNAKYEKGEVSYKKGVTMFTDMTEEEYLKFLEDEAGGAFD